jgi:hypothetical protein
MQYISGLVNQPSSLHGSCQQERRIPRANTGLDRFFSVDVAETVTSPPTARSRNCNSGESRVEAGARSPSPSGLPPR